MSLNPVKDNSKTRIHSESDPPEAKRTREEPPLSVHEVGRIVYPVFTMLLEKGILSLQDRILLDVLNKASGQIARSEVTTLCDQIASRIIPGFQACGLENFAMFVGHALRDRDHLIDFEWKKDPITSFELETIGRMTQLQALYLTNTHVIDEQLEPLSGLVHLNSLDLNNTGLMGEGLAHLTGLSQLTRLNLLGCDNVESIHFPKMTRLKKLYLSTIERMLPEVSTLPELTTLHYDTDIEDATDLESLGKMPALTKLNLSSSHFSFREIESLMYFASLTRLRKLYLLKIHSLQESYFDGQHAFFLTAALIHLTQLDTLKLTLGCLNENVTQHLAQLTHLNCFELYLCSQKTEPITSLSSLSLLTALNKLGLTDLSLKVQDAHVILSLPKCKDLLTINCSLTPQAEGLLTKIHSINEG